MLLCGDYDKVFVRKAFIIFLYEGGKIKTK